MIKINGNKSVAMIESPRFINVEPYNPMISECEIKVFYLGANRNGSYIDEATAVKMANTLPGCPIVGAWREETEDFGDHGHIMHIEDGEVSFSVKTRPYGFVAPDAKVWFQKFLDTDEFGNSVERTYLMTTGYLWSGQYPELESLLQGGKGQSMEIEEVEGSWSEDDNSNFDIFIINDAVFSKLCILGDSVEPCFEGAAVTTPQVSKEFSFEQEFTNTLFTMMKELKEALTEKGGSVMPNENEAVEVQETETTEEFVEDSAETSTDISEVAVDDVATESDEASTEETITENIVVIDDTSEEESVDTETTAEIAAPPGSSAPNVVLPQKPGVEDGGDDDGDEDDPSDEDDGKDKTQVDLADDIETVRRQLIESYARIEQLDAENTNLRTEVEELRDYKLGIEREKKFALVNKFYMLSDEDKANIVAHIDEYSLDEINSQLAVLYVSKNVDFSLGENNERVVETVEEEEVITTFTLEESTAGTVPALVQALRKTVH